MAVPVKIGSGLVSARRSKYRSDSCMRRSFGIYLDTSMILLGKNRVCYAESSGARLSLMARGRHLPVIWRWDGRRIRMQLPFFIVL